MLWLAGPCSLALSVFDGVFDTRALKSLAPAAAASGLGHTLYSRREPPRTILEAAVDSFLREMSDDSPYVEYWSRQEWKHIEAHADVDEALAAAGGILRYPRHAHVLYLEVGSKVRGATCVWQPRESEACGSDERFGAMTAVPAVAGRVLRFAGDLQHAVPRPADVWFSSFVINQRSTPPEDYIRSVLLFNTWPDPGSPPKDVQPIPAETAMRFNVHDAGHVLCRERRLWKEAQTAERHGDESAKMKVWLLGDANRRMQSSRTLELVVPAQTLDALNEASSVTLLK